VISVMDPLPLSYATGWVAIALDPNKEFEERIAALRGIAALGPTARPACADLHNLLGAPEPGLRHEAGIALHAIRDPSVIGELAKRCRPHAERFDSVAIDALLCLRDIADFGPDGREAGSEILSFLDSKNGAERSYAILTLGRIGYKEAAPEIELALKSPDWRIVDSAVWSLGWLGDHNAIPLLEDVASAYWLPEVRKSAARSATAIQSPDGHFDTAEWEQKDNGLQPDPFAFVTEGPPWIRLSCKPNRWSWKGQRFKLVNPQGGASSLRFQKSPILGELVGTDNGEWGGQLPWLPFKGQPEILIKDNVRGMEYELNGGLGAVVFLGLGHMGFNLGYVLRIGMAEAGTWNEDEIARLPGQPDAWGALAPSLFAVEAHGRVVVFSTKEGILGLAACSASH
jgi:hypothetical protein